MRLSVSQKLKRCVSTSLSIALSLLTALPAQLHAQMDLSAEEYEITFQPSGNRRIVFRDLNGNFIGWSGEEANLPLTVNGNIIRNSIVNGVPDTLKIIKNLPRYVDTEGRSYLEYTTRENTYTAEGTVIPPGRKLLLDVRYFLNEEVVAAGATGTDNAIAQDFSNAALEEARRNPKTQELTAPVPAPAPRTEIADDEHDHDDEADDEPIAGYDGSRTFAKGLPFKPQIFSSPLCACPRGGCLVTSNYGRRRSIGSKFHKGLDIGAAGNAAGAKVIAAAPGIIKAIQTNVRGGYGIAVFIDHGNGVETRYAHLKNYDRNLLKIGARIERGQYIGMMGNTGRTKSGRSYKQHLHFEIRQNGVPQSTIPRMAVRRSTGVSEASRSALSRSCSAQPDFFEIDASMNLALKGAYTQRNLMSGNRHIRRTGGAGSNR